MLKVDFDENSKLRLLPAENLKNGEKIQELIKSLDSIKFYPTLETRDFVETLQKVNNSVSLKQEHVESQKTLALGLEIKINEVERTQARKVDNYKLLFAEKEKQLKRLETERNSLETIVREQKLLIEKLEYK